jgi:hypothetical protein
MSASTEAPPPVGAPAAAGITEEERLRRWRLALGGSASASCGAVADHASPRPDDEPKRSRASA